MEVVYFKKVIKFILSLKDSLKNRIDTLVDMLEEQGNLIGMPYSKSLGKGLFELRELGDEHIRILYCFHKNKAYLIHGFIKKTQKISPKDIEFARKIKKLVDQI